LFFARPGTFRYGGFERRVTELRSVQSVERWLYEGLIDFDETIALSHSHSVDDFSG